MRNQITPFLILISVALFPNKSRGQWEQQTSPTSGKLEALYFLDENIGFTTGGFVPKLYKTTDGGITWTAFSNYPVRELQFIDENVGYASSSVASATGTMQKTINGGVTFTGITPPNSSSYLGVFAVSSTTAFFINTQNKVLKTTDGGASVTSYSLNPEGAGNQVTDIFFTNATTGFICTNSGTFYTTTDAGTTWENTPTTVTSSKQSIYFVNESVGYIGGNKILKTTDGGETWEDKSITDYTHTQSIKFYDENNGIAVGLLGKIFRTEDGGDSWIEEESGITSHLRNVFYVDQNTAVAVGDDGAIVRNGSLLSTDTHPLKTNLSLYPNPVSDVATLRIANFDKYNTITLEIYDSMGRIVRQDIITTDEYQLEKSGLSGGVYLMIIKESGKTLETLKFIIK